MKIHLAYGKDGLDIDVPDLATVVEPAFVPGLVDEGEALRQAMRAPIDSPPLRELVLPGNTVTIVHSDITRPMPNDRVLPVVIDELIEAGISPDDITLLNGLGTHRPQTHDELVGMLGEEIVTNYRCLQHDCWDDDNLVPLGTTLYGNPVRIDRQYMETDVKILTGFIEPHFFAGFSGGPKAVLPSIAGIESVMSNHGASMVGAAEARWGVTHGNPIWDEMLDVAQKTEPTFLLNVTINRHREITGIFAGDVEQAHARGCEFCRQSAMVPVPHAYDIVITSNSGYPLDLNLYQAVKGMSAASEAVRQGGSIIVAAECWDGLPDHGEYARLLRSADQPSDLLNQIQQPDFHAHDQWQVQVQAQIQAKAEVHVYSDGLSDEQIQGALLQPSASIEATLADLMERYGPDASICVLPDGPMTVPTIAGGSEWSVIEGSRPL
jgi:nickel-dependent lactate racemase